jgi:DNA-binding SARP family transcriptional activator
LGCFQAELDGELVTSFEADKVRGLLAYLAVEADRPHRRETLAGMFWPDRPERRARANLSQALFNLRRSIGDEVARPPFLLIDRETIQFNGNSEHWLDVAAFHSALGAYDKFPAEEKTIRQLEEAVTLYHGDFLQGFSLADSPDFEVWCLFQREQLHRLMSETLGRLTSFYEHRGEYEQALQHARRQLELDPWREEVHATLMRLLALNGRRSEALAQYETCRRILAEELDVEPLLETKRLYERIRDGLSEPERIGPAELPIAPPYFLTVEPLPRTEAPFVARDRELERLDHYLGLASAGQGQVVFISGEAGSGKTVLIQEFARRAQEKTADLVVAAGKSTAYTGIGDPYSAFREILAQLSGDVETRWAAGAINREQAIRLWRLLPRTVQALMDVAPDLINTFVSGKTLLDRATVYVQHTRPNAVPPHWFDKLEDLVIRRGTGRGAFSPQQSALFEQYARLLTALARQFPLLLLLDDLQWADAGSTSLLFHLGRQLTGNRLLLLGAYRPEEINILQDGKRHPLEPVVHEFQRDFGDVLLPIGQTPDRAFVEAILDSEPNNLMETFRERLFRLTGGHPLFTVELLRGLQERGDLIQDEKGRWQIGATLDWETLPPRVEGVIAERFGRLPEREHRILQVASVQGETFVAEVVAQVEQGDAAQVVPQLSGTLSKDHRLVRAHSLQQLEPGGAKMSHYQFHHFLFQKYLYHDLDEVERTHLHEATGKTLEELYGEHTAEIAVQLARHFQGSGNLTKAIDYLLQAGNYALRLSANEEAISHFTRALDLIYTLPETPALLQQELSLQLSLGTALQATRGYASPDVERVYTRARRLCQQIGRTPELLSAMQSLTTYSMMRAELHHGAAIAEEMLVEAKIANERFLIALAHQTLGWVSVHLGHFVTAHNHLDQVITSYDPVGDDYSASGGHDLGVGSLGWDAWALWFLGYPEQARRRCQEAIALARTLDQSFSLTVAYQLAASCHVFIGDAETVRNWGEKTRQLAKEHGFAFFQTAANVEIGWSIVLSGRIEEGVARIHDAFADWQAMGVNLYRRATCIALAEKIALTGQIDRGLALFTEAEGPAYKHAENYCDAEYYRVKGMLRLLQGYALDEVESCFHQAIQVARQQKAKSWELRATTDLCRLWQEQGRGNEARQQLAELYDWFSEGFDTLDLQNAAQLLEELS